MKNKTIKVDYLARVEGEGALHVKIKQGEVKEIKLRIFEPPRFFEAFLRGRKYSEAPDITARICGICPVAYQMSSVQAMENALGIRVDPQIRALRRLLYCGEWIESHTLHVYMLHAPDFLGYDDAIQMARDYPEVVKKALELKKTGNLLVSTIGGREIHPINVKVGGFYRLPQKRELQALSEKLKWALDAAVDTVRLVAKFPFPEFEQDYEFVALSHPDEYAINEGRLMSNKGLNIAVSDFERFFTEEQVEHSNALHSFRNGRANYFVGPLARFNLNFDRLSPRVRELASEINLAPVCKNPFKSIIVRSLEIVYACEEALRLIAQYEPPSEASEFVSPRAAGGYGCTEAPRGILYHRYRMDEQGIIKDARIIPPTSQNLKTIESDLFEFVSKNLALSPDNLTWRCEQAIRNYDPCISCATHFMRLKIERE
jgi:coenzyme F420-reducing hydrogenase alpha subunit